MSIIFFLDALDTNESETNLLVTLLLSTLIQLRATQEQPRQMSLLVATLPCLVKPRSPGNLVTYHFSKCSTTCDTYDTHIHTQTHLYI